MPENRPEITPPAEVSLADKERPSSRDITIDILDRIDLDVRAKETEGKIEAIVDESGEPREDRLTRDGLLVDELKMDALAAFFKQADVGFIGDPWVARDQEDRLGEISISAADLNKALKEGRLVLSKRGTSEIYAFKGLDQFVKNFVTEHLWDDKYNPEDV